MISKSVNDYFEYDVITKIVIKQEYEMTLPAVTLCVEKICNNATCISNSIFILKCEFNANTDCINNFQYNNYNEQTCITFNAKNNSNNSLMKSQTSGLYFGMEIKIYIPGNLYMNIAVNDNQVKPSFSQIANLIAEVQTENYFILNKLVDKKLPSPYSKCENTSDSPLLKEIVESNITYTREYCLTLCGCKNFTRTCDCSCPTVYENQMFNQSCYTTKNDCVINAGLSKDLKSTCYNLCPLECESTNFEVTTQTVEYDFTDDKDIDIEVCQMYFNKCIDNSLIINFYYETLKYTETTQIAKTTIPDIISMIGGTMGLFLGLSLLSFIEVLGFFIEVLFIFIQKLKPKKTRSIS